MGEQIFELLNDEMSLFQRIQELEVLGYEEQDMYVITKDEDEVSILKRLTNIMIKEETDSILDRFKSFLKGEDSLVDAFNRMGVAEEDREYYYNEVKKGRLLLLVDPEYKSDYILGEEGLFIPVETEELYTHSREEEDLLVGNEEDIPEDIKERANIKEEVNIRDNMDVEDFDLQENISEGKEIKS